MSTIVQIPSDEDLIELIGRQESQEIKDAPNWKEDLIHLAKNGEQLTGDCLPWSKTHNIVRLRPGEITIWAGMNGHKKSMISGMVALWLSKEHKICIASMEMKPVDTLYRMAKQSAGCKPSVDWCSRLVEWGEDRIFIYDQVDTCPPERVLGMVYYAAKELGCKHIVIDSLTKCGIPSGESGVEKLFIDRLAWAAKTLNIHIHLIAHVRKPQSAGEEYRPTKFDVRGAGELTDLVDNVFLVWANKRRLEAKQKLDAGFTLNEKEQKSLDNDPDQLLTVAKQRHGSWEGVIQLWFDDRSLQFTSDSAGRTEPFTMESL